MKSASVFDKYAHEYDILTNAPAREKSHREEVRALIERFHPTHVLDAGCGAGLTASLFARQRVEAVGLDRSRAMIAEAQRTYGPSRMPVSFISGSFERLPKSLDGRFDLVVCLANSISGVDTAGKLKRSFAGFHRMLKPGGHLVLQVLNYRAVPEGEILPIRATRKGKIGYLRFTRRRGSLQELTVVRLDFSTRPFSFETFVHEFENFGPKQLKGEMKAAGFCRISSYGNLLLSKPFGKTERDLVLTAHRKK